MLPWEVLFTRVYPIPVVVPVDRKSTHGSAAVRAGTQFCPLGCGHVRKVMKTARCGARRSATSSLARRKDSATNHEDVLQVLDPASHAHVLRAPSEAKLQHVSAPLCVGRQNSAFDLQLPLKDWRSDQACRQLSWNYLISP